MTTVVIAIMNNWLMEMTVLDGVEQLLNLGLSTVIKSRYAGQFIWTGFDYRWTNTITKIIHRVKSSFFGIIDTAGLPKNDFYLYRSE